MQHNLYGGIWWAQPRVRATKLFEKAGFPMDPKRGFVDNVLAMSRSKFVVSPWGEQKMSVTYTRKTFLLFLSRLTFVNYRPFTNSFMFANF